jgi:ubiquinone/menaquinone biosynthesis C-methylase UbiE
MDEGEQSRPDAVAQAEAEAGWWSQSAASAANYERRAVPAIFRPWAERLLDRLTPASGTSVLDLACGTGVVARHAAERVGPRGLVAGLDISPAMLAVARSLPAPAGAPLHWHLGTATVLPCRAAAFDAATCAFGLMFVRDRARMLTEVRRALKPGGRLAVSVWGNEAENPVDGRLIAALARYAGADEAAQSALVYSMGDPDVLRRLLTEAGFRSVEVESLTDEHRMPLDVMLNRVVRPGMDDATRAAARRHWLAELKPYIDGDQVRYPVTAHLATALG